MSVTGGGCSGDGFRDSGEIFMGDRYGLKESVRLTGGSEVVEGICFILKQLFLFPGLMELVG